MISARDELAHAVTTLEEREAEQALALLQLLWDDATKGAVIDLPRQHCPETVAEEPTAGMASDDLDVGYDLRLTKVTRHAAGRGTWVRGTLSGHRFDALVFPEHAENPDHELGDSRLSKLWIQRLADRATVVNFDRGWDVRPTDDVARAIAGFLEAGLADHVLAD